MDQHAHEHEPVLLEPILRLFDPQPGDVIFDGTVGLGGHAAALLPRIQPGGRYIAADLDAEMLGAAGERLADWRARGLQLVHANYAKLPAVLEEVGVPDVTHMLLDLGVNSAQLDDGERGFSFDHDGPLDMRFDRQQDTRALDLVNRLPEKELSDLFYFNSQERASRKIAKRICQVRHEGRITTTKALARAVESAVYSTGGGHGQRIHPATRVFQALRIAVNRELDNVEEFLQQVLTYLRPGGKFAVISFHSLEDGLVKRFVRQGKAEKVLEDLTPRPIVADPAERERNPRSRSAKLRVARKVGA